jgi:hypothetical protein
MENPKPVCPAHQGFASNCCHNEMSVFKVDKNYSPSSFQVKEVAKNILHVFDIPLILSFHSLIASNSLEENTGPPQNFSVSAVSLADICVYRI